MLLQVKPTFDNPVYFIAHVIMLSLFTTGFLFAVRKYRREKSHNSIVLLILMGFGLTSTITNIIRDITDFGIIQPFIGFIAISLIITTLFFANKRLEESLEEKSKEVEESEEKYKTLVNNITGVILKLDSDLQISYVSNQVREIFGYKPSLLLDQKIVSFINKENRENVKQGFNRMLEGEQSVVMEFQFRKYDNTWCFAVLSGSVIKEGNEKRIIGIMYDITERKKAEELIKEQVKRLKELDQMRSDLVRRTSHELKTPLISIYSSSQYLLNEYGEEMNDDIKKIVKVIHRGGKRLHTLTQNLLDAFQLEGKNIKLHIEEYDMVKSIENCANDLVFSLKERDLFLKMDLNGICIVKLDKMRLEQVILNILSNAIKNTPPKGLIYITLDCEKEELKIIIRDTGIGITEDERKTIFKKFGKIERKGIDKDLNIEGSGLGLYISKEIVELHGGKITVESAGRNKGTTFIISLPREI